MIKSKLLHVFLIIQPVKLDNQTQHYKVSVISKTKVPFFGPVIHWPYVFKKDANLKKFLLSKLINAEYASLKAPAFSSFSEKTLEQSLLKLCETLENLTNSFNRFDFSNTGNVNNSSNQNQDDEIKSLGSSVPLISTQPAPSNPHAIKGIWRKFSTNLLGIDQNTANNLKINYEKKSGSEKQAKKSELKKSRKSTEFYGNNTDLSENEADSHSNFEDTSNLSNSSLNEALNLGTDTSNKQDEAISDVNTKLEASKELMMPKDRYVKEIDLEKNITNKKRLTKSKSTFQGLTSPNATFTEYPINKTFQELDIENRIMSPKSEKKDLQITTKYKQEKSNKRDKSVPKKTEEKLSHF